MSRVFLVEVPRGNIDTASARNFGELTYIFEPDQRRSRVFDVDAYARDVLASLTALEFDPDRDYFALTGPVLPVNLSLYTILRRWGRVQVLMFVSTDSKYVSRTLTLVKGDTTDAGIASGVGQCG